MPREIIQQLKEIKTDTCHFQKIVVEQENIDTYKNRIYVHKDLRTRIVKWYHHYLRYPREASMHKILASTLYWEKMEDAD